MITRSSHPCVIHTAWLVRCICTDIKAVEQLLEKDVNIWPYDTHNCLGLVAERSEASKHQLSRSGSPRLKSTVDPNRTNNNKATFAIRTLAGDNDWTNAEASKLNRGSSNMILSFLVILSKPGKAIRKFIVNPECPPSSGYSGFLMSVKRVFRIFHQSHAMRSRSQPQRCSARVRKLGLGCISRYQFSIQKEILQVAIRILHVYRTNVSDPSSEPRDAIELPAAKMFGACK